jgi:hypothetical protein
VIVLIEEENHPAAPASLPRVDEEEWQRLIETIRQSEPFLPTLDEAMNFSRGRP